MDELDPLMDGLTERQATAVLHSEGPLLVLAGPGSGKTTVVTRRIARLIRLGIPPWEIVALTFTNKAATEMRNRVQALLARLGLSARGLTVTTFHAFGAIVLRRHAEALGRRGDFTIYDASDQRDAIRRAMKRSGVDEQMFTPGAMQSAISRAKNRLETPEEFERTQGTDFRGRRVAQAYRAYDAFLRENDALDFDDLLRLTARLLTDHPDVRTEVQSRARYLLIDEYQDTNHAQFVIAHEIAKATRNIAVVGDPDQSIYAWRGADISNILDFESRYPEATVVPLGENFRSTGHIVRVADTLIRSNRRRRHKDLSTQLGPGERPRIRTLTDEHAEAASIAGEMADRHRRDGTPLGAMAVLYRTNALSRVLETAFRQAGLPYIVARGTAFFERREIRDVLAYLRLIQNPMDEIAFERAIQSPARGIGRTTIERVLAAARSRGLGAAGASLHSRDIAGLTRRQIDPLRAFGELIDRARRALAGPGSDLPALVEGVIRESGLAALFGASREEEDVDRLGNLNELVNAASEVSSELEESTLGDALGRFLERVALVSDADRVDPQRGAVTLMTLHAAKGLEFDVVAIAGLEQGLLPHANALADPAGEAVEEERRLLFVGITRARRTLLLTRARQRMTWGSAQRTAPSDFLHELPADDIEVENARPADDPFLEPVLHEDPDTPAALPKGCRVRHPTFGVGRVESVARRPAGTTARVDFGGDKGVKTLVLEYARLVRID